VTGPELWTAAPAAALTLGLIVLWAGAVARASRLRRLQARAVAAARRAPRTLARAAPLRVVVRAKIIHATVHRPVAAPTPGPCAPEVRAVERAPGGRRGTAIASPLAVPRPHTPLSGVAGRDGVRSGGSPDRVHPSQRTATPTATTRYALGSPTPTHGQAPAVVRRGGQAR